jgi:hypothetical protein
MTAAQGIRLAWAIKALVAGYWLLGSLDVGSALLLEDALPAELRAWVEASAARGGPGEMLLRTWMLALLAALIAGSLGIFRFLRWGRWVFAGANLVMFLSYPLLDALVYTWFGSLFADLAFVLTGAILAVSFSPAYGAQIE